MRALGKDMLETMGYQVTVYHNGREALSAAEDNPGAFDMVLTDSRMPEMTGTELALRLRDISADLPIVMVTAFHHTMSLQDLREANIDSVVGKPFTMDKLKETIETVRRRRGI
jgi:DNA-binding response OmpR family regulator